MFNKKEENETIRCPYCIDGVWYKDPNFQEPYGYPYTTPTIPCEVCNGSKAILKERQDCRPDLEKITSAQRKQIQQQMRERKKK